MIPHITISTPKQKETVEFYQWLFDLPIARKIEMPGGEIIFLGEEDPLFEVIEDSKAEKITAKALSIGFAVGNLDEKLAMLDDKGIPHSDIVSPNPSIRFAFFEDLNGCNIQLVESVH